MLTEKSRPFSVLKELVEKNKIVINLDTRKSIDYYNKKAGEGTIELPTYLKIWYLISKVSGLLLLIGIFFAFFLKPWVNGVLLCLLAIYLRVIAWRRLKNYALSVVYREVLQSEDVLNKLYRSNGLTMKNTVTGKTVRYPEKWTVVLPKEKPIVEE